MCPALQHHLKLNPQSMINLPTVCTPTILGWHTIRSESTRSATPIVRSGDLFLPTLSCLWLRAATFLTRTSPPHRCETRQVISTCLAAPKVSLEPRGLSQFKQPKRDPLMLSFLSASQCHSIGICINVVSFIVGKDKEIRTNSDETYDLP